MKGLFWRITPLFIWCGAIVVLGSQLAVNVALIAGLAGCLAGFWAGGRVAASRVRLWLPWMVALPIQGLVALLSDALRNADLVARILGPSSAYDFSSAVFWFASVTLWVALLQASSRRTSPFVVLEGAVLTVIGASLFAAHRNGSINRPFFLVDPLWARGYDPLPVFLAIGGALAAIVVVLLASKNTPYTRKLVVFDVLLLVGLVLALFAFFPVDHIKDLRDLEGGGRNKHLQSSPAPLPSGAHESGGHSRSGQNQNPSDNNNPRDSDYAGHNDQPEAVVLLHDDYTPPDGYYYFRQNVFSSYNGKRLVHDTSGRYDRDIADDFPTTTTTLAVNPLNPSLVHALRTTVVLIRSHSRPFGLITATSYTAADNPDPAHFQRAYNVVSQVLTVSLSDLLALQVGSPSWNPRTLAHYTKAPTDPRYSALAKTACAILRPALRSNPLARAVACKLWLEKNGTYDLRNHYEGSSDPVGAFLFGNLTGYCVSFAQAAAILYRTVGVPARVGTGYLIDARFRGNGSALLVRSSNAHAWPEIYLQGTGWIPLDIAPSHSLVKPAPPPDSSQQDMYGDLARKKGHREPTPHALGNGDLHRFAREMLWKVMRLLRVAFLLLLLSTYIIKVSRRLQVATCRASDLPLYSYRAILDRLADLGHIRRYGQTREDFASQKQHLCPSLQPLTELHLEWSLGSQERTDPPDEIKRLHARALREIRERTTLRQRLLAFLNPVGWWRVR